MKPLTFTAILSLLALALAACGGSAGAPQVAVPEVSAPEVTVPGVDAPAVAAPAIDEAPAAGLGETLVDEQGAVSVAVTPLNVGPGATTLDFEVAMNTHSVDLGMDLAALATLVTDTGVQVTADVWDASRGGHHVSGVLSFPAAAEDGDLLAGASRLTLLLRDVDAAERTFTWNLN